MFRNIAMKTVTVRAIRGPTVSVPFDTEKESVRQENLQANGFSDTLDTSTETPDNFQWVPLIPASLHKTIEEELTRLNSGLCCLPDSLIMNQKDYEEAIEFFGHLTSEEQKVQNNYVVSLGRGANRKLK